MSCSILEIQKKCVETLSGAHDHRTKLKRVSCVVAMTDTSCYLVKHVGGWETMHRPNNGPGDDSLQ